MPIYEFVCLNCQEPFETLVLRASEKVSCPKCQSENLEKQCSTFAFKGSERFVSTAGSSGCTSCASHSCATCH